jgi:hypothetical protein
MTANYIGMDCRFLKLGIQGRLMEIRCVLSSRMYVLGNLIRGSLKYLSFH